MKVVLDTNVLLDVLLARRPWDADSRAVWDACDDGRLSGSICAVSVPDVFYIACRERDVATAMRAIDLLLAAFDVLPIGRAEFVAARALAGSDFEDNVHIAVSAALPADAIVTRNTKDFAHSPVRGLTPTQLVAQLPPAPPSALMP
jgi:predicted nucleic acid-binding protein